MIPHTPQATHLPSIYDLLHHTASLISPPPPLWSGRGSKLLLPHHGKADPPPLPFYLSSQAYHFLAVCRCIVRQPALSLLRRSRATAPAEGESFQVLQ